MNRRTFLASLGTGLAASVAGCTGGGAETPTPRVETVIREQTVVEERTVRVTDTPEASSRPGGDSDSLLLNPMGYTGADDLIDQQAALLDPRDRIPIVKKVLATIWNDAPTLVTNYPKHFLALNDDWEGWIIRPGGEIAPFSLLNIRRVDGPAGDRAIIGMPTPPDTLNVLATSTGFSLTILNDIYTYGTAINSRTFEFLPMGYESWELNADNVGTSEPTMTAMIRDGLIFNDGVPVAAEDAKFSVDYITEQGVTGEIAASAFKHVEEVTVDDPEGQTVHFFLSEPDNAWFTDILGHIFLPKHVWSHVSNYQQYTPRNAPEGIVGSGPFVLSDFVWESWYELDLRDEGLWQLDEPAYDFFDEGAPFIDGIRFEIFGSDSALHQAVLDRTVTIGSVPINKAIQAQRTDGLTVIESESSGWDHISFNLRRVPLDDRAFRQFLVRMLDDTWVEDELMKGVGGRAGSYVTPYAYQAWRPPEPPEQDAYEGIPTPDLPFPGTPGTFQLTPSQVSTIRRWLVAHPDAKHSYSWREADVKGAASADGKVLHVDGQPLSEAHTNNVKEPAQGPLEVSFNPPQEDLFESRVAQQWVGALKVVGVPVKAQIQTFNSQVPKVYVREDFDIFAMSWGGINVNNVHYSQMFGSDGADLGYPG